MTVLFASAEMAPVARVGGLGEAVSGLVRALRAGGVPLDVVLPDYGDADMKVERSLTLDVPAWASPAVARRGVHESVGELWLVSVPEMARPHPYVDEEGEPWPDNEARFMAFAAAVAALADEVDPEVLHLNDWHTAASVVFTKKPVPTILTIHTLGYQGVMEASWLKRLPRNAEDFEWYGGTNPLAGAIRLADIVSTVSPNYAAEILTEEAGMGLHEYLGARGTDLVGIRNGIDAEEWNPATDRAIAARYSVKDMAGKAACREALLAEAGWAGVREPVIGVVSRLVHQKGIDLLAEAADYLASFPARLVVLGSGEPELAARMRSIADDDPGRVWFTDGYDVGLAHRIFAGADLLAMPSRFEPCGLAQMQAMAYGTIPVVTPVGGLVDTVLDADASRRGTGFVAKSVTTSAFVDALHRAVRAHRNGRRRDGIRRRGMQIDWSWQGPARHYRDLYATATG